MAPATPSDMAPVRHTPRHPLINRQFALLWSGQTVSIFGDFIFTTTLVVWIAVVLTKGQTWTPLAVSGVFLAASLPQVLLGPLAGVFVDRWNKRLALAWASFLPAVCVLLLLVQVDIASERRIGQLWQLGLIYLTVFLINSCAQVARPAWLALTGAIVAQDEQPRAMGLDQASTSLAMLIGPAIAPPLLLAFGPVWALLINLLSFLISALTILLIRMPGEEHGHPRATSTSFLTEARAGGQFLWQHPLLRTMLILSIIAWLGGGALSGLDIFFVTQNLHTPPAFFGVLDTALGVGTILGAVLAGALGERLGLTRLLWCSVLALGGGILLYARLTSFVPALVVLFLLGIPFATLAVVSGPLVLRATPQELLGRVSAWFAPCSALATLLGSAAAGAIASALAGHFHRSWLGLTFGPIDTIFMGAGVLLLLSGLYAMLHLRGTVTSASTDTSAGAPQHK